MDTVGLNLSEFPNSSSSGEMQNAVLYMFLCVCAAGVVLLTVCGNMLVIISIAHFKQLHTPTNLFILSLAVADLLVGLIVMPCSFSVFIGARWTFSKVFCMMYNVSGYYLTCVSIYNVAFIAIDRFLVLCDPFFYFSKVTLTIAWFVIFLIWFMSLIYNIIFILFNKHIVYFETPVIKNISGDMYYFGECYVETSESWAVVDLILVFIVPCFTMIFLYVRIFAIVSTHANTIRCTLKQEYSLDLKKMKSSMASEHKAAKTLGILVAVFLLCLIPSCICALIDPATLSPSLYTALIKASYWIILSNSLVNPLIYAFFYPWFQKCLKVIITCGVCALDSSLKNMFNEN